MLRFQCAMTVFTVIGIITCLTRSTSVDAQTPYKTTAVLFPVELSKKVRSNADRFAWAAEYRQNAVEDAKPWMALSDDELWKLMFGPGITRSWMVWSNGYCPSCKQSVPMYEWRCNPIKTPWKFECPRCKELFPKNDFGKFYESGLDEHGVFDSERADRSLLFNTEHPDPGDALYKFGVDDGEGYVDGDKRWRFIGAYLIYGLWKQAIVGGAQKLATAYILTGDKAYAHKAAILLDRAADLYPEFDYIKQGLVYEVPSGNGYVSIWHDACEEIRELALSYDQIFDGIKEDTDLVVFLSDKARKHQIGNPKSSFSDIQRNIEDRLFRDTINHRYKIESNYPRTDISIAVMKAVLEWPSNKNEIYAILDRMIEQTTAVDGVTGEKGVAGYTAYGIQGTAVMLAQFSRLDSNFLKDLLKRHPRLHQTYRFHIDTWCLGKYYPNSGDSGWFASQCERYIGVSFLKNPGLLPSMYTFMWNLYEVTGDKAFVQALYSGNDYSTRGLPYDLTVENAESFQKAVQAIIDSEGKDIKLGSINKQQWNMAILRSGQGENARALTMDYDAWGRHGHADGMNISLFAKGLDLLPDFGYPPVNYGGWGSPRARWYTMSAAHNTVVVDGRNHAEAAGKTTLWADGVRFRAVRTSAPNLYGIQQYERTAILSDISERDFYLLDIFRVTGGKDHARFIRSLPGSIETRGLSLKPVADYGYETQMRNFASDTDPQHGWSVTWNYNNVVKHLKTDGIHLRCTDLTPDAHAGTAESWITVNGYSSNEETWIPTVITRRQSDKAPLNSTFISILEPYETGPYIQSVRRLALETPAGKPFHESNAAVEIVLIDGQRDIIATADVENPLNLSPSASEHRLLVQKETGLTFDGELCLVRFKKDGSVSRIALCKGRSLSAGNVLVKLRNRSDFIEITFDGSKAVIEAGSSGDVDEIRIDGKMVVSSHRNTMKVKAWYYQQFDANYSLDVPGEGYGGWKQEEIEISPEHTAVVVMHAWEHGTREQYPGWYKAVEYIKREDAIEKEVFPKLLSAVRASGMKLFHVAGGGDYYKKYPGYKLALESASPEPKPPDQVELDPVRQALDKFRTEKVFPGTHNVPDIGQGFTNLDFPAAAKPLDDEGIAANASQLFGLCKQARINHLIYAGFAINGCLLLSPGGIADMSKHGIMCSAFRQAVTAIENKESARTESHKEEGLWRVAILYGFVFDVDDFISALKNWKDGV